MKLKKFLIVILSIVFVGLFLVNANSFAANNVSIENKIVDLGKIKWEPKVDEVSTENKITNNIVNTENNVANTRSSSDFLHTMTKIMHIIDFVAIFIIGLAIIKFKKTERMLENFDGDENTKEDILKKANTKLIVSIIVAIMLFGTTGILQTTQSFKPIIYLYPTEETNVSVNLLNSDKITCSYPKYVAGWNVLAKPNGDLIDLDSNKNLYSLYYENENVVKFKVEKDGFVVKGEDTAEFLEEKLSILGLTEREAEEFIIYWLPKLESNKYNYIRFATTDEINENMPLEISPVPDTLIRVLMTYKGLKRPITVQEQQLETPAREGFVAVEWGGTEIK